MDLLYLALDEPLMHDYDCSRAGGPEMGMELRIREV